MISNIFKKNISKKIIYAVLTVCILVTAVLEFKLHRRFVFLWDDLWYSTHLVTGEKLSCLKDVFDSQYWHYFNWGGRTVNHTLLQLLTMAGERLTDVINMIVTFTLSFLICQIAGKINWKNYCLAFFLLIGINTDIKLSMFWQSGSTNYLYSSNWILLFLLFYLQYVKKPESKKSILLSVLMLPLGLITGWSNENIGPACMVTAFVVIFYCYKYLKKKAPIWMWIGAASSLLGSLLLILAPGNFIRKTHVEDVSIWETLYQRFLSMLTGGFNYLFPTLLFLLLSLFIYLKLGNKIKPYQVIIMITAVLSYGAMILSPTFPNRATFGIMVLCIILILSFLNGIEEKDEKYRNLIFLFTIGIWLSGIISLLAALRLPL